MEMIFVGTGSGKASLDRYFTSTLFRHENRALLIDAGDGVSRALLSANIPYNEIDSVLFTHFHPDHLNGISSLLIQMKMQNRLNDLTIYVHEAQLNTFNSFLHAGNIYREKLDFKLKIYTFRTDSYLKVNEYMGFNARLNSHIIPSAVNKGSEPVSSGFLLFLDKKKVCYTGDISSWEDLLLFRDERFDVLITEATHIEFDLLSEAFGVLNPDKMILTHIDHLTEQSLFAWHAELPPDIRDRIILASDGMKMNLF